VSPLRAWVLGMRALHGDQLPTSCRLNYPLRTRTHSVIALCVVEPGPLDMEFDGNLFVTSVRLHPHSP
jgi:hypothetical protein